MLPELVREPCSLPSWNSRRQQPLTVDSQHPPPPLPSQDVEMADAFFAGHMAPAFSAFPYPRDLFLKFIAENDGGC